MLAAFAMVASTGPYLIPRIFPLPGILMAVKWNLLIQENKEAEKEKEKGGERETCDLVDKS
jgi:hypothetical protein